MTTQTPTLPETLDKTKLLPPYAVILHNDDVNEMGHVVSSLLRSVPELTPQRAEDIMLEAHNHGQTMVIVCPFGAGGAVPRTPGVLRPDRHNRAGITLSAGKPEVSF